MMAAQSTNGWAHLVELPLQTAHPVHLACEFAVNALHLNVKRLDEFFGLSVRAKQAYGTPCAVLAFSPVRPTFTRSASGPAGPAGPRGPRALLVCFFVIASPSVSSPPSASAPLRAHSRAHSYHRSKNRASSARRLTCHNSGNSVILPLTNPHTALSRIEQRSYGPTRNLRSRVAISHDDTDRLNLLNHRLADLVAESRRLRERWTDAAANVKTWPDLNRATGSALPIPCPRCGVPESALIYRHLDQVALSCPSCEHTWELHAASHEALKAIKPYTWG